MIARKTTMRLAFAAMMLGTASLAHAAIEAPVKTVNGLVQGVAGKQAGITAFKGIPFAAPPVGELRWKAPQPAANWSGVRDGGKYSKACMQAPGGNRVNPTTDMPDSPGVSEDCLYLNVWTGA